MVTKKPSWVTARLLMLPFASQLSPKWSCVGKHGAWRTVRAVFLLCAAIAIASPAQTFKTLVIFDGTNGADPLDVSMVQGLDGNFYGTTNEGGVNGGTGAGTVFKMTAAGKLTTIFNFCIQKCTDGAYPPAGLFLSTDRNFYGTTTLGGVNNFGTVFKITPEGKLTTLYSFCALTNCADGSEPLVGVIQAADGDLYGTTWVGGTNGAGTVFKITPKGKLTTLYSFCAQTNCPDGANPAAGLFQAADGEFYGTTSYGGANQAGTVFRMSPAGTLTNIYTFCPQRPCTDGYEPQGTLIQAHGDFYGTTFYGGANNEGTVFKVTPQGVFTVLYSFCAQTGCADGSNPAAGIIQANDGNFYGTSSAGVTRGLNHGYGTVFELTAKDTLTTLHSFDDHNDGAGPLGGLLQATNGNLYGTTPIGGANLYGTIFGLSVGLRPFVETLPTLGKVGTRVTIMGTNLTGATRVTFNGTAAKFTVVSSSEIKTTVPTGATTGKVKVTTPKRTLSSNLRFRVTK
jgi:uncharacterized repeat protein (TIGR03803 family)